MYRPLVCCCALALLVNAGATVRGGQDPVEVQIRRLRDADPAIRVKASEALLELAADSWRQRLRGNPSPKTPNILPALLESLEDKDVQVRRKVVTAIGLLRESPKLAVPALVKMMDDKDVVVNENAVCVSQSAIIALSHFGPEAKEAVPVLLKCARSNDEAMKGLSIGALARIGAERDKVVPLLLKMLKDKREMKLWGVAARSLTEFGPNPDAVPLLKDAFEKVDVLDAHARGAIQDHILCALKDLGNRESDPRTRRDIVAPFLLKVAKDRDRNESLRRSALRYLGELRPPTEAVAKDLVACMLSKKYQSLPFDEALVKLGPDAVFPLMSLLDHPDVRTRGWGAVLLGRIGSAAAPALPKLMELSQNRDRAVASQAADAIEAIKRKRIDRKR